MGSQVQEYISRVETSKNLPTLPHILVKLISTCQDEHSGAQDIARIIRNDISMAAKILKLANSSYFRTTEKISQIDQALIRLGRDAVKNLAISSAIHQVFSKSGLAAGGFDLKRFWRHCLTTAVLARMIAEKSGYSLPEQAFLAGMVHDIGRLILVTNFPDEYEKILMTSEKEEAPLIDCEIRTAAPHTEIGAWLLKRWMFDSTVIDAVLYHHEPVDRIRESFPLVRIVYAANDLSRLTDPSDEDLRVFKDLFSGAVPDAAEMVLQADAEVRELADSLGLPIGAEERVLQKGNLVDLKIPELIHEVKDQSLLVGVLQNLISCSGESAILAVIQDGLNILFDVRKAVFFLIDADDGLLKAKVASGETQADTPAGWILSLNNKDSLIVESIRKNRPLSSFRSGNQAGPAILDEQIRHGLESEGILCVPLSRAGETVGAIVVGLQKNEEMAMLRQEKLLDLYAAQSGAALYVDRIQQAQAKKIAAERVSATTDFARKVVHEANNPLGIIKNYLKILSTRFETESQAQREFRVISEEIDRIARMLKGLSDFAKDRAFIKNPLDMNVLLGDIVRIIGQSLPASYTTKIHTRFDAAAPPIRSDRDALKQVFINLMKNAVEALAGRGNIYVETTFMPDAAQAALHPGGSRDRGKVKIVVRDDGPGISPDVEARLFEPYTSTKRQGHSGIGLSVVYNTVKELGGEITYESASGKGAVFTILLPADLI